MNAMEQMAISMLAKMTGLSPEEMQGLAAKAISLLQSADTRLAAIERDVKELHAILAIKSDPVMPELLLTDERQMENVNGK